MTEPLQTILDRREAVIKNNLLHSANGMGTADVRRALGMQA